MSGSTLDPTSENLHFHKILNNSYIVISKVLKLTLKFVPRMGIQVSGSFPLSQPEISHFVLWQITDAEMPDLSYASHTNGDTFK